MASIRSFGGTITCQGGRSLMARSGALHARNAGATDVALTFVHASNLSLGFFGVLGVVLYSLRGKEQPISAFLETPRCSPFNSRSWISSNLDSFEMLEHLTPLGPRSWGEPFETDFHPTCFLVLRFCSCFTDPFEFSRADFVIPNFFCR